MVGTTVLQPVASACAATLSCEDELHGGPYVVAKHPQRTHRDFTSTGSSKGRVKLHLGTVAGRQCPSHCAWITPRRDTQQLASGVRYRFHFSFYYWVFSLASASCLSSLVFPSLFGFSHWSLFVILRFFISLFILLAFIFSSISSYQCTLEYYAIYIYIYVIS